jgi:hypothetical protein
MTRSSLKPAIKRQRNQLQPARDSGTVLATLEVEADENPMAWHFALAIAKAPRKLFQSNLDSLKENRNEI